MVRVGPKGSIRLPADGGAWIGLSLKYEAGLTHRAIAQACGVGLGTVSAYLARAAAAGVTWPLPDDLDDAALEARLFARPADPARGDRTVPAWPHLHQELKRPGVTLHLLWTEYRAAHPTGFAYSQFCERYRRWGPGAQAIDAAGASRRREALCRFLREAPVAGGHDDGRTRPRRTLRRCARRGRSDLCRGHLRHGVDRAGAALASGALAFEPRLDGVGAIAGHPNLRS